MLAYVSRVPESSQIIKRILKLGSLMFVVALGWFEVVLLMRICKILATPMLGLNDRGALIVVKDHGVHSEMTRKSYSKGLAVGVSEISPE